MKLLRTLVVSMLTILAASVAAQGQDDTVWVRRYDGPDHLLDAPVELEVDDSGNVYVAGTATDSSDCLTCITLKYTPDGQLLWERRYKGLSGMSCDAVGLVLNDDGSVIVAGTSFDYTSEYDFAIIKYDSSGTMLWDQMYDGPEGTWDIARDITTDTAGNVYVTGSTWSWTTNENFATVKYDRDGNQLWARWYNSPRNHVDGPRALAVDGDGNVCVTGLTLVAGCPGYPSCNDDYDFLTVKYDPDGTLLWEQLWDGDWIEYYPGSYDEAYYIQIDREGNVFVAGLTAFWDSGPTPRTEGQSFSPCAGYGGIGFYATVKYDADGNLLWYRYANGPCLRPPEPLLEIPWSYEPTLPRNGMRVDSAGAVYLAGASDVGSGELDFGVVKYDSDGTLAWMRTLPNPSGYDEARMINFDSNGFVYAAGTMANGLATFDYRTIAWNGVGDIAWDASYAAAPGGSSNYLTAMRLDGLGDVYVTGQSGEDGSGTGYDFATIRYAVRLTCDCPHQGDSEPDGFITSLDLAAVIDALFAGSDNPQDPDCQTFRYDADCDGATTSLDLAAVIDYLYAAGAGPCDPCGL
jgi:uncharacterized delta-60 repeat protein